MIIKTILLLWSFLGATSSRFEPSYPITAALFNDRFSVDGWDDALGEFSKAGGDTVWLEAPPFVLRTKSNLENDPVFRLCQSPEGSSCFDQAESDLGKDGTKIVSFATYQYEEDFSDNIMRCKSYDQKMVTKDYTFIRLVLPANRTRYD